MVIKVLPNIFKCLDNFLGGKNKMSAFTMYNIAMAYIFLVSFIHFRRRTMTSPLVATLENIRIPQQA